MKEPKLYYLIIHDESDCIFICRDFEIDSYLNSFCDIVSQGFDLDKLINQGFSEARKRNFTFEGYKEIERISNGNKFQKKELKPLIKKPNPIKLKHS